MFHTEDISASEITQDDVKTAISRQPTVTPDTALQDGRESAARVGNGKSDLADELTDEFIEKAHRVDRVTIASGKAIANSPDADLNIKKSQSISPASSDTSNSSKSSSSEEVGENATLSDF